MEEKIVEMFGQGCSAKEIETTLSTNYQMVVKVLLKHGIDYKEEYKKKQEEKYSKALEMYKEGMQFKKICKTLNIGPNQLRPYIKSILGEENWKSQRQSLKDNMDKSEEGILKRSKERIKYSYNEECFSNLEDEETAYWIGFLYADGTIGKGNGQYKIALTLKESDLEHIKKFCKYLQTSEERITYINSTKAYNITIGSYTLWKKLVDLGFTNKKSWDAKPPELLKNNRHFWRGVIDGDGSLLSKKRKERNTLRNSVEICGTPDTVIEFIIFCEENTGFNFSNIKICDITKTFSTFRIGQKDRVLSVSTLLYKDSNIYLERKYKKYLEFEEFYKAIEEGG